DLQATSQDLLHLRITTQEIIAQSELVKQESIPWIQDCGALQDLQSFFVLPLTTKDVGSEFEYSSFVRQAATRRIQFRLSRLVIAQRVIGVTRTNEMRLAGFGPQFGDSFESGFGKRKTL